jgi:hypothetical protein
MRRTLKLLLLLGIGLALAGNRPNGPNGTPGNFDKVDIPAKYKGLEGNSTAENHDAVDDKLKDGEPDPANTNSNTDQSDGSGDGDADSSDSPADSPPPPGVPDDWPARTADNGKGTVYQDPESSGNADMVRVMEPNNWYPNGYVRFYNSNGQPVGLDGKPGPNSETHIPINEDGTYDIPEGWDE